MSNTPTAGPNGFRVTRRLILRDIFALRAWLVRFRFYDLYTILRGAISQRVQQAEHWHPGGRPKNHICDLWQTETRPLATVLPETGIRPW